MRLNSSLAWAFFMTTLVPSVAFRINTFLACRNLMVNLLLMGSEVRIQTILSQNSSQLWTQVSLDLMMSLLLTLLSLVFSISMLQILCSVVGGEVADPWNTGNNIQMDRATVNIKKLIADSEFGDIQELSKRWQRSDESSRITDEPDLKENIDRNIDKTIDRSEDKNADKPVDKLAHKSFEKNVEKSMEVTHRESTTQSKFFPSKTDTLIETDYKKVIEKDKKTHTLQFIDEDTEHFKVRLEHLLNVFRTDAVSQFMTMKRSMLDDQKEQVRADTEKYLRLYEEKHQQLIKTRESLNQKSRDCENLTIRCERMAKKICEDRLKTQTVKCLAGPFMQLVRYREYKIMKRKKEAMAITFRQKMLERKGMLAWRENHKICSKEREEKRLEGELNEVTDRYQKEIQLLRERLTDSTARIEDYERNKSQLQDNLKKAFMKGVCAMNFEAMSVLNTQGVEMPNPLLPQEGFSERNSLSDESLGRMNQSVVKTEISFGGPSPSAPPEFGSKSVVFYKHPKIESKDHNWKDAPVLNLAPREPREMIEDLQPINIVPECLNEQEGRVIKVVNGKSSVISSQGPPAKKPTNPVARKK